jgi:hypothetical protein
LGLLPVEYDSNDAEIDLVETQLLSVLNAGEGIAGYGLITEQKSPEELPPAHEKESSNARDCSPPKTPNVVWPRANTQSEKAKMTKRNATPARASPTSDSDSIDDFFLEFSSNKIPKPQGEAGRPGRGGYNLERMLNWEPKSFKLLKVRNSLFSLVVGVIYLEYRHWSSS